MRLQGALAAGTYPEPKFIEILVRQCAIETDFFVRDTLSWALLRNDREAVVQRLIPELNSENIQAKTQAIHTLTKIGDKKNYTLLTSDMLLDKDDFVASTAWRAASVLVPDDEKAALIRLLITQLGRGDSDVQFALTRFLCALGEAIVEPLGEVAQSSSELVRHHAEFTLIRYQEMQLDSREKKVKSDE
jgi:HEAT repeat protein